MRDNTITVSSPSMIQRGNRIFFIKKTPENIEFIKKWYSLCCIYNLIDDSSSIEKNDSSFIEHRHDQSIKSLLAKQYGTTIINDVSWFSDFNCEDAKITPILATRKR